MAQIEIDENELSTIIEALTREVYIDRPLIYKLMTAEQTTHLWVKDILPDKLGADKSLLSRIMEWQSYFPYFTDRQSTDIVMSILYDNDGNGEFRGYDSFLTSHYCHDLWEPSIKNEATYKD